MPSGSPSTGLEPPPDHSDMGQAVPTGMPEIPAKGPQLWAKGGGSLWVGLAAEGQGWEEEGGPAG